MEGAETTERVGSTESPVSAGEQLAALAGQLNVANARLVELTAGLLESGGWEQGGARTPAMFLQHRAGLSPERAKEVVRVARRRDDFPVMMAAFGRGELSLEQVAAAVGAPAWADALVFDFVRIATVTKIRRAVRSNRFEGDPVQPADEAKPVRDRLSFGVGRDGRWRISGELDAVDGRRVEAALSERRDALFVAGDEGVTWPQAFVDCMERSLDAVESVNRRDRFRTWLHLDVGNGDATLTDGWRLPMAVRDRALCDGTVQPVWESDGVPFNVGRAQHIVPDRTRRIVERRDRGCRVPGCGSDRFVEIHHIVHWVDGGRTDTSNLISLCPQHHRMHHQGELGIAGDADRFDQVVFTDRDGCPIPGSGTPVVPTGPPSVPDAPYRPPLAGRFDWNWIGLGWVHPDVLAERIDAARARAAELRNAA